MPTLKTRRKKSTKRVLALPDLEHGKTAVLNSLTSASGQRTYDHAIREFVGWYCSEPRLAFNRTVVLRDRASGRFRACRLLSAVPDARAPLKSPPAARPPSLTIPTGNCGRVATRLRPTGFIRTEPALVHARSSWQCG
jgi:hypothetical protein